MLQKLDRAEVRIWIEGVLFPYAKSVVVSGTPANTTCRLEIPPSPSLRTEEWIGAKVHIFYANQRVVDLWGEDPGIDPPPNAGWPILFQGEMGGDSNFETVESGNTVITCRGHSRHFQQTQMYFFDPTSESFSEAVLASNPVPTVLGNLTFNLDASVQGLTREVQVTSIMNRRLKELGDSEEARNIAFTSMVLEILRAAANNHALFGYFDVQLKLSQRFAAYVDPDVRELLSAELLKSLVDKRVKSLSGAASLFEVLDIATNIMKYNWNHISQPSLRGGSELQDFADNPREVLTEIEALSRKLAILAPQEPSAFRGITLPAGYWTGQSSPTSIRDFVNAVYEGFVQFQTVEDGLNYAINILNLRPDPSKKQELTLYTSTSTAAASTQLEQEVAQSQDVLNEFTITPNMEFSSPPRCNVLFPTSFRSFSINRNYFQEITRLFAIVPMVPNHTQAPEWYVAPTTQGFHLLDGSHVHNYSLQYEQSLSNNFTASQK